MTIKLIFGYNLSTSRLKRHTETEKNPISYRHRIQNGADGKLINHFLKSNHGSAKGIYE